MSELMNVTDSVIKHYRELLEVENFNNPKDRKRLELQIKLEKLDGEWSYKDIEYHFNKPDPSTYPIEENNNVGSKQSN